MTSQLYLPKYLIVESVITEAALGKYGNSTYISILTNEENNGGTQSYPAYNINDKMEAVDYFTNFMGIENIVNAVGKKVIKIGNNHHIFALWNLENNEFFSMQSQYPSKNDIDLIEKLKEQKDYNYLNKLTITEAVLIAHLSFIDLTKPKDINRRMEQFLNSYKLELKLNNELSMKENTTRIKI